MVNTLGAREMAALVKHLPCVRENLSLDPQYLWKNLGVVAHLCNSRGGGDRWLTEAHWLVCLAKWMRPRERDLVLKLNNVASE